MPLPQNFSPWEHLQDQISRVYNKEVRDWFRNDPEDDLSTPRASLRVACLIDDKDTSNMVLLRMFLFYVVVGRAKDFQPPMYTIPLQEAYERVAGRPQIKLFFLEDRSDVEAGYEQVSGEIGIRLMNETSESLTMAEARRYAQKIKTLFGPGTGFEWKKGRESYSYTDPKKGYRLKILSRSETEARRVIEQVLDIQGHTPDWDNMNQNTAINSAGRYPTNPGKTMILGKSRKKPRRRPVASVRFQHSELHVDGLPRPIVLFDNSGRFYREALEK